MNDRRHLQQTVLHDRHLAAGARIGPFAGFEMPIQYQGGIVEEHQAARRRAALFDTCHMGEFLVVGEGALRDLQRLLTCPLANLRQGRCRYSLMCNEQGGVIDDLLVYRLAEDQFMLVVNAAGRRRDWQWLREQVGAETRLIDQSDTVAKIDLQGPLAPSIAESVLEHSIRDLVYFAFHENLYQGEDLLVSRTGYTGEIGFEFYCSTGLAGALWDDCLRQGATPAGLGARDTLRLEMGMPLYGHELHDQRNAAEAGLGRAIADDRWFVGADQIRNPSLSRQKLRGLALNDRRAARAGDPVLAVDGRTVLGTVTSGSFAPSLGYAVALAYIDRAAAIVGDPVLIGGRRQLSGKIVSPPFYREGTARAETGRFFPDV